MSATEWFLLLAALCLAGVIVLRSWSPKPPAMSHGVGLRAADELTTMHHVVAIGREAQAIASWQFVIRVEIGPEPGQYTTYRTIMSPQEQQVVANVVQRAAREGPKA